MSYISSNLINLGGNVTGTLPAANGGLATNAAAFTGVVKSTSGVFSAATIVNADISASAAISGTKIVSATTATSGVIAASGTQILPIIADMSSSTTGIKVEIARSAPASTDVQNVYSGSWTPILTISTGFTTSGSVTVGTGIFMRVGNIITAGFQFSSGSGNLNGASVSLTSSLPIARGTGSGIVAGSGASASVITSALPIRVTESSATACLLQSAGPSASGGTATWAIQFLYTLA